MFSTFIQIPSTSTAMIGPILQRAVIPKESALPSLFLRAAETPAPSDMMNGTVIGPVVTPPESKESGLKLSGRKNASTVAAM